MPRMGRLRAALRVAQNHGRGPAFQRVLSSQARFFEANGALKPSHQGRRQKQNGLLDDEGFYMGVQRWLCTLDIGIVNPKLLQQHVIKTLLPSLSLKKTSYRRKKHTKGVYWDGHERKDIKMHRKEYIAELADIEPFIAQYAEPDMTEVCPELGNDELEHLVIVHDKSTIHSNDYQNNHYWLKPGEEDKIFEGQPKGMTVILAERSYTTNTNGKALIGECKVCKASRSHKPHLEGASPDEETDMLGDDGNDSDKEDERPVDCCMQRLLSHQLDFAREKSQLELLIKAEPGMLCHFLPKFHPEMNPIEYFWAWVKQDFRERSNGQWQKAKDLTEEALHACPLPTIRRFFRHANRYASVYRLGAIGVVAEFAVKRYHSHRGVLQRELDVAKAEWEKKVRLGAI
ncbi:hypothetical protein B0H19DRAFT_1060907 [Mycena capillaripes]|nr:hypothetical protein B0H19DRAFT_1060907 [Mycena capillaripes]